LPTVRIFEAITLRRAPAGHCFDLGAKPGQYGHAVAMTRQQRLRKNLDHDGPLSWALAAPSFRWLNLSMDAKISVAVPRRLRNGFVGAEICFVGQCGRTLPLAKQTSVLLNGSLPT
jgi:hypothetical protein